MEALSIIEVKKEPRVSSEELAMRLKITAKAALNLVDKYIDVFQEDSPLVFN